MTTTVVTTKGQVVIPSAIRAHLKLTQGTKLCVEESGGAIMLRPLNRDYFDRVAGILDGKGSLTGAFLKARAAERLKEKRKWSKF